MTYVPVVPVDLERPLGIAASMCPARSMWAGSTSRSAARARRGTTRQRRSQVTQRTWERARRPSATATSLAGSAISKIIAFSSKFHGPSSCRSALLHLTSPLSRPSPPPSQTSWPSVTRRPLRLLPARIPSSTGEKQGTTATCSEGATNFIDNCATQTKNQTNLCKHAALKIFY